MLRNKKIRTLKKKQFLIYVLNKIYYETYFFACLGGFLEQKAKEK